MDRGADTTKHEKVSVYSFFVVGSVIAFIMLMAFVGFKNDGRRDRGSAPNAESYSSSTPDSSRVITEAKQLKALRELIVRSDHRCENISTASRRTPSSEGDRIKVYCGPATGGGDLNTIYMLTMRPSGRVDVKTSGMILD